MFIVKLAHCIVVFILYLGIDITLVFALFSNPKRSVVVHENVLDRVAEESIDCVFYDRLDG